MEGEQWGGRDKGIAQGRGAFTIGAPFVRGKSSSSSEGCCCSFFYCEEGLEEVLDGEVKGIGR